jgi:multiple sugar transport system ATP-binding protein
MDQRVRAEIRARIRHLHDEMKNTTVYVTHDQAEAVSLCDRMVILHQAELQQIGTVEEIWNRPANRFVAFFVGEPAMNFLPAKVEGERSLTVAVDGGRRSLALPSAVPAKYAGKELTLGLRPQQLKVHRQEPAGGDSLPGKVRLIEFQGETTVLTVSVGGEGEMKAVVAATERYAPGQSVWLSAEAKIIHLFDGEEAILKK